MDKIGEWATIVINILAPNIDDNFGNLEEATEKFEDELNKLIAKYDGREGMKFDIESQ